MFAGQELLIDRKKNWGLCLWLEEAVEIKASLAVRCTYSPMSAQKQLLQPSVPQTSSVLEPTVRTQTSKPQISKPLTTPLRGLTERKLRPETRQKR